MAKILVCESASEIVSGAPQCDQWVFYDAVIMGASEPANVQPEHLGLAFATGFGLLLPVYFLIWKIKAARSSILNS